MRRVKVRVPGQKTGAKKSGRQRDREQGRSDNTLSTDLQKLKKTSRIYSINI